MKMNEYVFSTFLEKVYMLDCVRRYVVNSGSVDHLALISLFEKDLVRDLKFAISQYEGVN